ncbi:MAG: hypothetical protein J6X62_06540 [Bacteroidales bacterium]|nr:hypothetical protein [Bacteroidales bacterium]
MNKRQYIAPTLTVVTFAVEHGFAYSGIGLAQPNPNAPEDYNDQAQENWEDGGNLFGDW